MNLIKAWKENWLPWCKVSAEMKAVAEKITKASFLFWYYECAEWLEAKCWGLEFAIGTSYRLPEDFKCPHTDTFIEAKTNSHIPGRKVCTWCGEEAQDKPKVGWVRYGVKTEAKEYWFDGPTGEESLDLAIRMVGFGGVKYRRHNGAETDFLMMPPLPDEDQGPYIPVAVRFWEAVK